MCKCNDTIPQLYYTKIQFNFQRTFQEKFADTNAVIRIWKSNKDSKHNVQKNKDKRTNNDLQNTTHKF